MDAVYLALAIAVWLLMAGFAAGCAKLEGHKT